MTRRVLTPLRLGLWIAIAATTAWVWASSAEKPSHPAPPAGVLVLRDLTYRAVEGRRLALDLYLPDVAKRAPGELHPILIAVHGGSWIGGSRTDYGPQFGCLARNGIAVAVVDYRLARPGAPSWPGAPADIAAALDWLETHADAYRLDSNRVAAIGASSGGLLAALAGVQDRRFRAIICLSAPMDLGELIADRSLAHEPALAFLGDDPRGLANRAREASPISHVQPGQPPMLLIHGTEDRWVSIEQARDMRRLLEEAGVPNRLIEIEGARHGFQLQVMEPEPRDLLPEILAFLEEAWGGRVVDPGRDHAAIPSSVPRVRGLSFLKSAEEGGTIRIGTS